MSCTLSGNPVLWLLCVGKPRWLSHRSSSSPEGYSQRQTALGCPELRPASANQPLGPRWLTVQALSFVCVTLNTHMTPIGVGAAVRGALRRVVHAPLCRRALVVGRATEHRAHRPARDCYRHSNPGPTVVQGRSADPVSASRALPGALPLPLTLALTSPYPGAAEGAACASRLHLVPGGVHHRPNLNPNPNPNPNPNLILTLTLTRSAPPTRRRTRPPGSTAAS